MVIVITLVILALVILLSVYVYKESTGYTVTAYELNSNKIKQDINIAYLSDLHNTEYGKCNDKLIESIEEIDPDIVIFGGDMVTSCMDVSYDFGNTLKFIEALSKKYPIYYGIGNHESKFRKYNDKFKGQFDELTRFLNSIDVPLLADSKDELNEFGIDLYCLDIDYKYYRKVITRHFPDGYIEEKLGSPDKNKYSILIAHNPEHFESCAGWGADLVLSGHVHGGVMEIPYLGGVISPALKLFPKYDSGKFTHGDTTMILSRGIGSHTVPIRINNKAEIVNIHIRKENKQ